MLLILITNTKYSHGRGRLRYLMQADLSETIYNNILITLCSRLRIQRRSTYTERILTKDIFELYQETPSDKKSDDHLQAYPI